MKKTKIYHSNSNDPYVNLAIENKLLLGIESEAAILFFYINDPCIVMGRFQNPWIECNLKKIKKDRIKLVRRQSGGGTVYHDHGNINFCFIHGGRDHQKDLNNQILIKALKLVGISGYISDRSDLRIDFDGDKKFSGAAFKQKKESAFHHGTLLIDSNLDLLNAYLKSNHEIQNSKSTKSISSTVINLSKINTGIDMRKIKSALVEAFNTFYETSETAILTESFDLKYLEKLKSWKWIMAETPKCLYEKVYDDIKFSLEMGKGRILNLEVESVSIHPDAIELVKNSVNGIELKEELLMTVIDDLESELDMYSELIKALRYFFKHDLLL